LRVPAYGIVGAAITFIPGYNYAFGDTVFSAISGGADKNGFSAYLFQQAGFNGTNGHSYFYPSDSSYTSSQILFSDGRYKKYPAAESILNTILYPEANLGAEIIFTVSGSVSTSLNANFNVSYNTAPVNRTLKFTPVSVTRSFTYSWNFGDSHTSTQDTAQHAYTSAGIYNVTLTVSDGNRLATSVQTVTITGTTTALNSLSNANISVYPNPTNGELNISNTNAVTSVDVLDIVGHTVISVPNTLNNAEMHFSLDNLQNGMYFVRMNAADGSLTRRINIIK
jgi:PKD repeat protein